MPFVMWDKSFLLGVEQLDQHHKHLVGLLNKIYDDYTTEVPSTTVGKALNELTDYAAYHFTAEELWMENQSYFKLDEHKEEHDRFSKRVSELQKDYHTGKLNLSLEILFFLKNWLTDHILNTDANTIQYISAKNEVVS